MKAIERHSVVNADRIWVVALLCDSIIWFSIIALLDNLQKRFAHIPFRKICYGLFISESSSLKNR